MSIALILVLIAPLAHLVAALRGAEQARAVAQTASFAATAALAAAVFAAIGCAVAGPATSATLGGHDLGLSLRLDALSATMLVLVAFVGWAVVRYARTYLDGDPHHSRFMRALSATLAAVLTLVVAGNMILFVLAWIATSLTLHRLLLHYPERPNAILAARKKFVAARLSDICLIGATVLVWRAFGTLDIAALAGAAKGATPTFATSTAAVLIALAALLKSAQLPLHGWLTEVMETPTPVSALLHAGVVNAGGFLVLRFADLMSVGGPALNLLAIVGGISALTASFVMLTQTSVKVALAWSTIAQMGFMLFQCGLGAFPAALLHIVAHSLYKAHAFLASGSVIDILRASWSPSPGGRPHRWRMTVSVVIIVGVAAIAAVVGNVAIGSVPATFALTGIFLLGIVTLVANGLDERPQPYVVARTLGSAAAVTILYLALQGSATWLMRGALPNSAGATPADWAIAISMVTAFAALTILQGWLPDAPRHPRLAALWVHAANGFYLNTHANRLAIALWPGNKGARP